MRSGSGEAWPVRERTWRGLPSAESVTMGIRAEWRRGGRVSAGLDALGLQVVEDLGRNLRIQNDADDLHRGSTAATGQRADLEAPASWRHLAIHKDVPRHTSGAPTCRRSHLRSRITAGRMPALQFKGIEPNVTRHSWSAGISPFSRGATAGSPERAQPGYHGGEQSGQIVISPSPRPGDSGPDMEVRSCVAPPLRSFSCSPG